MIIVDGNGCSAQAFLYGNLVAHSSQFEEKHLLGLINIIIQQLVVIKKRAGIDGYFIVNNIDIVLVR